MDGNSPFERTVWGRLGWFLQQLLKFYAGRVLALDDFVIIGKSYFNTAHAWFMRRSS